MKKTTSKRTEDAIRPPGLALARPSAEPSQASVDFLVSLFMQQQYQEAETLARGMTRQFPNYVLAWKALGAIYKQIGRGASALEPLQRAVRLSPDDADVLYNLGVAYLDSNKLVEAEASYRRALEVNAQLLPAHFSLGQLLQTRGEYADAEISFRQVLQIDASVGEAYNNLAMACFAQGHFAEAETQARQALVYTPDLAEAHDNLGNALKAQGRLEEAKTCYEAAVTLQPAMIEAHFSLSALKTYHDGDAQLIALEQQASYAATMPMERRIRYWFTLGKAREDLADYNAAFAAYQEGNRLQRTRMRANEAAEEAMALRIMTVFDKPFFASHTPSVRDKTPILIVGMPRSGTTLLEQILGSYPGVFGAGELTDLGEVVADAMPGARMQRYPDAVVHLSTADFERMAQQYIERLWSYSPAATHIVDKMLSNFLFIGMLQLMLPGVKIIHAMRDPMDSCFSCYANLFDQAALGFTYDLKALGQTYRRYITLMRHWHTVLPAGSILDVRYEDMVADTEKQVRRLLDYLGFEWNPQCLAFHQNKRTVNTVSAAQVRRPIYRSSVARWERFAAHLGPLLESVQAYRDE